MKENKKQERNLNSNIFPQIKEEILNNIIKDDEEEEQE